MLNAESRHDVDTGVCEIAVSGSFDLRGASRLRLTVMKSLVEQPVVILVDLNATLISDPTSLLIIPTLERRAWADYGLHLRCYISNHHPQRRRFCRAVSHRMPLYPDRSAALAAGLSDAALERLHSHLPASRSAPAAARRIVDEVCRKWNIGDLAEDAQMIVSELAANAVRHTGLDFDLVLLLRPPFLHIQVIDGDPRVPLFPIRTDSDTGRPPPGQIGGWGLYLVYAMATGCGVAVRPPGKIVWATLWSSADHHGSDPSVRAPRAP